ncbi:hypothetical protein [Bacillus velezensis]
MKENYFLELDYFNIYREELCEKYLKRKIKVDQRDEVIKKKNLKK